MSVPQLSSVGGHGVLPIGRLRRSLKNRARHSWKLARSNASRLALTSCILYFSFALIVSVVEFTSGAEARKQLPSNLVRERMDAKDSKVSEEPGLGEKSCFGISGTGSMRVFLKKNKVVGVGVGGEKQNKSVTKDSLRSVAQTVANKVSWSRTFAGLSSQTMAIAIERPQDIGHRAIASVAVWENSVDADWSFRPDTALGRHRSSSRVADMLRSIPKQAFYLSPLGSSPKSMSPGKTGLG